MIAARAVSLRKWSRRALLEDTRNRRRAKTAPSTIHFAFEHVDESLRRDWRKRSSSFKLGRVLRESRADGRRGMNDGRRLLHPGERRADERVGRLQKVVGSMSAASLS